LFVLFIFQFYCFIVAIKTLLTANYSLAVVNRHVQFEFEEIEIAALQCIVGFRVIAI